MDRSGMEKGKLDDTENERMSALLSRLLEREFLLTQEAVDIKRRSLLMSEWLLNDEDSTMHHQFQAGSRSEGVDMVDSDTDILFTDLLVTVLYPDPRVPQISSHKTILYMKEAQDCRPGFVSLELGQLGKRGRPELLEAFVQKDNTYFVSSDIYREQCSNLLTKTGIQSYPNGPSNTVDISTGADTVICFPCNSWPKVANEWLTRTRLYGWPSEKMINSIGQSGCHIVPVGDKCSHDTLLQWRISFVAAERRLVHSLSHIQFKVYVLLKYFLKQIKGTLKDTVGDDDILCSYFMKILIFVAVENTSQRFWQERNFFYCFWFCFNILIDWVLVGYCPNYFIPAHNMFQRKVHGQHQRMLIEILNNCHRMKWMCFPHLLASLSNPRTQAELQHPRDSQDIDCGVDITVMNALRSVSPINRNVLKTMAKTLHLLSKSQTESEEIITYKYAMNTLSEIAGLRADQGSMVGQGNKLRYKTLRKCKHWLIPRASFGTNVLYLATFHFLMGDYKKSLEICTQVMPLASNFKQNVLHRSPEEKARYVLKYTGQGQTLLSRCRKEFKDVLMFFKEKPWMCLPHLHPELSKCNYCISICPLPYAVFLLFLCFHELGDTGGRDAALRQLIVVKYEHEQGGHKSYWVHYLLHICYKTLGDNHRADRAYRDAELASASMRWRK